MPATSAMFVATALCRRARCDQAPTEPGGYSKIHAFNPVAKYFSDKPRQDCCSGLGKRASVAIRYHESKIRNRVRFNASKLQPLPIL